MVCSFCLGDGHNCRTCPLDRSLPPKFVKQTREYKCGVCLHEGHNRRTCEVLERRRDFVASSTPSPTPTLELTLANVAPDEPPMEFDLELTPTPRDEVDIATDGYTGILLDNDVLTLVGVEVGKVRDRLTREYWIDGTHRFRNTIRAKIWCRNRDIARDFVQSIGFHHRRADAPDAPFFPLEDVVAYGRCCVPCLPPHKKKPRTKSQKGLTRCGSCGNAGHRSGHKQCPLNAVNQYFKNGRWHHRPISKGIIDPADPIVGSLVDGSERNRRNYAEYLEKCYLLPRPANHNSPFPFN